MKFWEADWYRRTFYYNLYDRDQWVRRFARQLPPGTIILDAGAGPAPYRSFFDHCQYQSQDFAQEPSTLGNYTKLDYVSDITSIPAPACSFDAIICTEVFEHLPEPIRAIQEFSRLLKPDGILALSAPLRSRLHQEPFHFYGGFTPHWYKKFLPEQGFEILEISCSGGFFSHFAQESARFNVLLDPRFTQKLSLFNRVVATGIWLLSLPVCRLALPLLRGFLDRLELTNDDTLDICVRARKRTDFVR